MTVVFKENRAMDAYCSANDLIYILHSNLSSIKKFGTVILTDATVT